jgi:hypothetical protein
MQHPAGVRHHPYVQSTRPSGTPVPLALRQPIHPCWAGFCAVQLRNRMLNWLNTLSWASAAHSRSPVSVPIRKAAPAAARLRVDQPTQVDHQRGAGTRGRPAERGARHPRGELPVDTRFATLNSVCDRLRLVDKFRGAASADDSTWVHERGLDPADHSALSLPHISLPPRPHPLMRQVRSC